MQRRAERVGVVVRVAALGLFPLMLAACGARDTRVDAATQIGTAPPDMPVGTVSVSQLLDTPAHYAGRMVTVSGEVNDVLGPKAFTIGGDEFLSGELLVVSPKGFPQIPDRPEDEYLVEDDLVLVTGRLRSYTHKDITQDFDAHLEDRGHTEWDGKPVLIVETLVPTPRARRGSASATSGAGATGAVRNTLTDLVVVVTTPARETLAGRRVQFNNVKVQSVVADRGFWIGPSASQRLFVVLNEERSPNSPTEGRVDVNPGQTVSISGTLRKLPMPQAAQQQWGLSAADSAAVQKEQIYLHADQVQMRNG